MPNRKKKPNGRNANNDAARAQKKAQNKRAKAIRKEQNKSARALKEAQKAYTECMNRIASQQAIFNKSKSEFDYLSQQIESMANTGGNALREDKQVKGLCAAMGGLSAQYQHKCEEFTVILERHYTGGDPSTLEDFARRNKELESYFAVVQTQADSANNLIERLRTRANDLGRPLPEFTADQAGSAAVGQASAVGDLAELMNVFGGLGLYSNQDAVKAKDTDTKAQLKTVRQQLAVISEQWGRYNKMVVKGLAHMARIKDYSGAAEQAGSVQTLNTLVGPSIEVLRYKLALEEVMGQFTSQTIADVVNEWSESNADAKTIIGDAKVTPENLLKTLKIISTKFNEEIISLVSQLESLEQSATKIKQDGISKNKSNVDNLLKNEARELQEKARMRQQQEVEEAARLRQKKKVQRLAPWNRRINKEFNDYPNLHKYLRLHRGRQKSSRVLEIRWQRSVLAGDVDVKLPLQNISYSAPMRRDGDYLGVIIFHFAVAAINYLQQYPKLQSSRSFLLLLIGLIKKFSNSKSSCFANYQFQYDRKLLSDIVNDALCADGGEYFMFGCPGSPEQLFSSGRVRELANGVAQELKYIMQT